MKLEVGMYCRYKSTILKYEPIKINKIIQIVDTDDLVTYHLDNKNDLFKKDIIKASHNIIDLIEVGDVVYLEEYNDYACEIFRYIHMIENEDNLLYIIDDIKKEKIKLLSIMTKEQFENNCFRIGDE